MRAKGLGEILVQIKKGDSYEMCVLTHVLLVSNLGRNLFSCYRATQKNLFTLRMKYDSQLIQKGNVVMTRVNESKMYSLHIKIVNEYDLKVVHANVTRLFGVETKKENT
jgi:hypothetical protein